MRCIGMDVHRDFCEVAIAESGQVRSAGRISSEEEELALFAQSLGAEDQVAMEVSGNAAAIARIIEPHVAAVILADPKAVRERIGQGPKTDRLDARVLAKLLAGGFLAAVWVPDEKTRVRRRLISRRANPVRHRTREKNHADGPPRSPHDPPRLHRRDRPASANPHGKAARGRRLGTIGH